MSSQSGFPAGSWNVDRIRSIDGTLEPPLEGSRVWAQFDDAGSILGSAGCNSYRGSYRSTGQAISVGTLATTRKFCMGPGVMEQESRYLELLAGTTRYSFESNETLRFFDDSDSLLLELSRAADLQGDEDS